MPPPAPSLPQSATYPCLNLLALAAGLGAIAAAGLGALQLDTALLPYRPLPSCLAVAAVLVCGEWLLRRRRGRGLSDLGPAPSRPRSWARIGCRLLGLAATLGLFALGYWLLPEYHGSFYRPYWLLLQSLAPVCVLVPLYFAWADRRLRAERDEYWQLGRLLCGHWRDADAGALRRHFLGWTVKAFFLPLMSVYLNDDYTHLTGYFHRHDPALLWNYDAWFTLCYTIDLLFCVVGYTVSLRLFDSHMRSVEPTLLGWAAALICYQPFYSVIGQDYLGYQGSLYWDNWLAPWPALKDCWAAAIIVLSLLYALATVAFGLRFSNLTHRGIITNGLYRLTKHPAYLSKNLSWWLISVPFVWSRDGVDALRHCALLLLVNGVYFLRARTEERHLSRDPVYVAYATWMNQHGLFAWLGRALPRLRYRPPSTADTTSALPAA
ncbi:MAG TPA: DUF1295 domain-containing protein [Steroidobacteraceae bacterium]|nr:DUF1295 domain-containing protein [Steroidobacteraceae bacterium]